MALLSMMFTGIAITCGNGWLVVCGIIPFAIALIGNIFELDNHYGKTLNHRKKGIILFVPIIFFLVFTVIAFQTKYTTVTYSSESYDIYHVDAPFGILWRDTDGAFVFGCGGISTTLEETYTVKYMIDNKLYTKQFDAQKEALEVDGTFKLEKKILGTHTSHWLWGESLTKRNTIHEYDNVDYVIHIPALLSVNGTTETYIIVP